MSILYLCIYGAFFFLAVNEVLRWGGLEAFFAFAPLKEITKVEALLTISSLSLMFFLYKLFAMRIGTWLG